MNKPDAKKELAAIETQSSQSSGALTEIPTRHIKRRKHKPIPIGFFTIEQIALTAKVALSTAYRWVQSGDLAATRKYGLLTVSLLNWNKFKRDYLSDNYHANILEIKVNA